jgi:DNA-binding response OmpR family regulator
MAATVLIVEDEADLASLLSDVLKEAGYDVELTTGTSAVQRAAEVKPALILMDYVMPGINGATVVAQMRETMKVKLPPLVLVSGRPEVQRLADEVGADAFLYKPFDVDELLTLVARLLGQTARH